MSLFGGSAPPSRSSYESDMSESSSTRSPPSVARIPDLHNAQEVQKVEIPVSMDVNDDLDTDTESEEAESEEEEDEDEGFARPNRFEGEPKTWRTYTEADRQIVESLDQIHNSDLSAHLYNAHAMKQRLQRPAHEIAQLKNWYNRDAWLKPKKDLKYTDAAGIVQEDLVPPDDWTAWPVPPAELLNDRESLDNELESDQDDDWIPGIATKQDAGEELREELLAVFLRIAKDRWNTRDASPSASDAESDSRTPRSRSRSKSVKSIPSRSTLRATSRTKDYSEEAAESGGNEKGNSASGKRRGRKPQPKVFSKPVILADDAKAWQLLQPSIQSMMSKLDELALAIYQTGHNHLNLGGSGNSSVSAFTSGVGATSRAASRAAPRATSRAASKAVSRATSRAPSEKAMSRSTSIRPSRASSVEATRAIKEMIKDNDADAMDSDATFGNSSDWESVVETPHRRKRRRSTVSESGRDTPKRRGRKLKDASLDWSAVLGLAATKGWDPGAIARTAQRCATLFGESMSFVPLTESMASKPISKPVWYTPSTKPAPSILSTIVSPTSKRPLFQPDSLSCAHSDCEDYKRVFTSTLRVIKHYTSVHGYDPRTNDSENEARMAGGVHRDGFLQPITLKSRWLSATKVKSEDVKGKADKDRKKQIKAESSGQSAPKTALSPE